MFRYSHATVLHELGIDDKTIQQWEGHASQETTTNIYIKNSQMMSDRAEAALSDFAASKSNTVLHLIYRQSCSAFSVLTALSVLDLPPVSLRTSALSEQKIHRNLVYILEAKQYEHGES